MSQYHEVIKRIEARFNSLMPLDSAYEIEYIRLYSEACLGLHLTFASWDPEWNRGQMVFAEIADALSDATNTEDCARHDD